MKGEIAAALKKLGNILVFEKCVHPSLKTEFIKI